MKHVWQTLSALLVLLIAVGCGNDVSPQPDAAPIPRPDAKSPTVPVACQSVSGARLSIESIELSPGIRQEYRVFDNLFGEDCAFSLNNEGGYSCFPLDVRESLFYSNAKCQMPIATFSGAPTQFARYRRPDSMDPCTSTTEYRRVMAATNPNENIFQPNVNGIGCFPIPKPPANYYALGPIMEATEFVGAALELNSPNTRVSGQIFVGDDGSEICRTTAPIDSQLDATCQVRLGTDDELHCLPITRTIQSLFSDLACTMLVEAVPQGTCSEAPSHGHKPFTGTCSVGRELFRAETKVETAYQGDEMMCVLEGTQSYVEVGAVVEPTFFPTAKIVLEANEGRLQRRLFRFTDGFPIFTQSWFDNNLDSVCDFSSASDGSFRCLPRGAARQTFYTTELCDSSIQLSPFGSCSEGTLYYTQNSGPGERVWASKLYEEPVYSLDGEGCTLVDKTFYERAFELSPSTFQFGEKKFR